MSLERNCEKHRPIHNIKTFNITLKSVSLHQMPQGCALQLVQAEVPAFCSGTVGEREQQRTQQLVHALAPSIAVQHLGHLVPVVDIQVAYDISEYSQRNGC
jgi:hypothetical protein